MLDVILLERIENLGQMGDVVKVKPGYARNFLLPKGKALRANKDNMAFFESQKKELEARNLQRKQEAEQVADKMNGHELVLVRQAGEAGQLYGSVTARDVAEALNDAGFKVNRGQVVLNQPIKDLGLFDVRVSLHADVDVSVSVNIARSMDEAKLQRESGGALVRNADGDLVTEAELNASKEAAAAEAAASEAEEEVEETEGEAETA
jgi:large subunit ribosomal protein L9